MPATIGHIHTGSRGEGEGRHWGVVLAGGEGARMRPWITRCLGYHRPKQYCTFVGTRSMLQHTLDRAARIVHPDRIVTIIGKGHGTFIQNGGAMRIPGRVIEQPANRDTGPGIFLPLAYILAEDPAATVLVLPSDHFIHPEDLFRLYALRAGLLADFHPDRVLLLGATPDRPEPDFGWIRAGGAGDSGSGEPPREVLEFREKPLRGQATDFLNQNYLWNTLIMACKGATLWKLGQQFLPRLMEILDPFRWALRKSRRERSRQWVKEKELEDLYQRIQPVNFSETLLQRAAGYTLVLEMRGVEWSDWGRPKRVAESLARIKKPLVFPSRHSGSLEPCRA